MGTAQHFFKQLNNYFVEQLLPLFPENHCLIVSLLDLDESHQAKAIKYFDKTIYPMLTPMVFDQTHTFPTIITKTLTFGVVTKTNTGEEEGKGKKLSFVQIPQNLPRFYVIEESDNILFLPIEDIIKHQIHKLYRNVEILSLDILRITRNGDFDLTEQEDAELDLLNEVRQKIKDRRLGRVTRLEIEPNASEWLVKILKKKWEIEDNNIFVADLIDFTGLWQIIKHNEFKEKMPIRHSSVLPMGMNNFKSDDIFETIRQGDIFLHHPYNSFSPVIQLVEQAAEDPQVLAIKTTLYRISKKSRIVDALLRAAENGKHVSVLFEVKARFDEERNIREAQRLQKAGCFVIFGIKNVKTHTKLLQVIRSEADTVRGYVHLSSGNYNEETARLYTDIGLLTCNETYTHDISEFFNVITGHSDPSSYQNLITAPRDMRKQLLSLIKQEAKNFTAGKKAGIVIKVNSLQDKAVIDELYKASQVGVPIKLIIRGICCLRPGRKNLSENISVRSIVGEFLEHTRLYYFHNEGNPKIYGGSADIMVRSFDRRIESLFLIADDRVKQQAIHILDYNLRDNVNAYLMQENGTFQKCTLPENCNEIPFNIQERFFEVKPEDIEGVSLF
jgi:polyphosphate kinase